MHVCILSQISFLVNLGCVHFEIGWRIALGLQCIFAITLILGMIVLPESPRFVTHTPNTSLVLKRQLMSSHRWLVKRGLDDEAQRVLQRLRMSGRSDKVSSDVMEELRDIQVTVEKERKMKPATWPELFGPKMRKRQEN